MDGKRGSAKIAEPKRQVLSVQVQVAKISVRQQDNLPL